MNETSSFIDRVIETAQECAVPYKHYFVDYDYLICAEAFHHSHFYIVQAYEDNYKHLVGVSTNCDGTLHIIITPEL